MLYNPLGKSFNGFNESLINSHITPENEFNERLINLMFPFMVVAKFSPSHQDASHLGKKTQGETQHVSVL